MYFAVGAKYYKDFLREKETARETESRRKRQVSDSVEKPKAIQAQWRVGERVDEKEIQQKNNMRERNVSVDACDAIWMSLMKRMNNSLMSSRSDIGKKHCLHLHWFPGRGCGGCRMCGLVAGRRQ